MNPFMWLRLLFRGLHRHQWGPWGKVTEHRRTYQASQRRECLTCGAIEQRLIGPSLSKDREESVYDK